MFHVRVIVTDPNEGVTLCDSTTEYDELPMLIAIEGGSDLEATIVANGDQLYDSLNIYDRWKEMFGGREWNVLTIAPKEV